MTTQINHAYLTGKLDGIEGLQLMTAQEIKEVPKKQWLLRLRWTPDAENLEVYQWALEAFLTYDDWSTEPAPDRHFVYALDLGWLVSNEQAKSMQRYYTCANDLKQWDLSSVDEITAAIARNEYNMELTGVDIPTYCKQILSGESVFYRVINGTDLSGRLWISTIHLVDKANAKMRAEYEAALAGAN